MGLKIVKKRKLYAICTPYGYVYWGVRDGEI